MTRKKPQRKDIFHQKYVDPAVREEALRPSRFLGFNHDQLGLYLCTRQAYTLAESEFRRAIWLNPFEPSFKTHLAWCLYKLGNIQEAHQCIENALAENPDSPEIQAIFKVISANKK